MIVVAIALLASPQDRVKDVLNQLPPSPPTALPWTPRETAVGRALASPFAPERKEVGLGNGLATWSLGVGGSGPPAVEAVVGGVKLGLGGTPLSGRAMVLTDLECTTFLKSFSVQGLPWPPRGATARMTYTDPARPFLTAELKLDMVDGYPNSAVQVTFKNTGQEAVAVDSVSFKRPGAGILLTETGSQSPEIPVEAFVLPGRDLTLPRMVSGRATVGGQRWPSGLWKTLAPWTAERRVMAWIRAGDVGSARAQVDQAADLGFQGVVVSVDHGDFTGVLASVADRCQQRHIVSGFALDASDFLSGNDLATPGDGKPCRTTPAAQRVVDRALDWIAKNGMQVLVDTTDWSHDCQNPLHDAHQSGRGFGFADGQAQVRTALSCVSHGIRLISRRDLRLVGATSVLDTAWSPPPATGAEFAVAVTRPHGLVPLAAKLAWPAGAIKGWAQAGAFYSSSLAFPLDVRALQGRAAAAQLPDGNVWVALANTGTQPGVEAVVTTPFAPGSRVSLSTGGEVTVGPGGTVNLRTPTAPKTGAAVLLKLLK